MVSARRPDPITRREFLSRHSGVTRREIFRQRVLRDRPSIVRQLFIDRDEIPVGIARAVAERENTIFDLSFAPLPSELNPEPHNNNNRPAIPAGEESNEEEDDTESISDASTISINLGDSTDGIPLGLLRAWERNAEIRQSPVTLDQQVQTEPSTTPLDSLLNFSTPNYSPIPLEELDPEPLEISLAEETLVDFEVNQILDYLNSEEFLDSIEDI